MAEATEVVQDPTIRVDGQEYLQNRKGHLVPKGSVKEIDLTRDGLVRHLFANGVEVRDKLRHFRELALDEVAAFVELSASEYGVKWGGKKGNKTFSSFDGQYKLEIEMSDRIYFDERLHIAKQLIDECMQLWTEGANDNVRVLVEDVFQVDKAGNLNVYKILSLRRHAIRDDTGKWDKAMQIISDSLFVVDTTEYVRLHYRDPETDRFVQLPLSLTRV